MKKTLLYRLFGLGKIPKSQINIIESEGVVLIEEGLSGSVTFKNFRAPGKRYSYRRNWFSGSLVATKKHFIAFTFFKPVIGLQLEDDRLKELLCSIEDGNILNITFDSSQFNKEWSGKIECRYRTDKAQDFLNLLNEKSRWG